MANETDALHSMLRTALHAYEQARAVRLEAGRQIAGELNQTNQTLNAAQSAEQARLEEMLRRKLAVAGGEQTRLGHLTAALAHLEQSARDLLTQAGLAHIAGAPLAVDGNPAPSRRGDAEVTALFTNAQTAYVELREALYLLAASQLSGEQWEAARKSVSPLLAEKSAPFYDVAFELQRQSYLRPAQQALEAGKWEGVRTTLEPWLKGHKEDEEAQTLHCESYYRPGRKALEQQQWAVAQQTLGALVGYRSNYKDGFELQRQSYLRPAQQALEAGQWEAVRTTLEPWLKGHKDADEVQAVDLWCESYYRPGKHELKQRKWQPALAALNTLLKRKRTFKDADELQKQAVRDRWNLVQIPAGEFVYDVDNQRIRLPEFGISYSVITYDQFKVFIDATGYITSPGGSGNAPGNNVSWDDAKAFCVWAGVALPTEQQLVRAALTLDEQGKRRIDIGRIHWEWCANDHESGGKAMRKFESDGSGVGRLSRSGYDSHFRSSDVGFRVVAS